MKKLNEQTKISECLKELFEDSTIHGIPRVIKTQTIFMKLFWAVCFLGATSFCVYLVVNTVFDYLNYDYVSNIETHSEKSAIFPTVTICNLNYFQTNDSIIEANNYLKSLKGINFSNRLTHIFLMNNILNKNESIRKANSFSLKESLISCEINLFKFNVEDFEWIFIPLYGGCYQFNSGKFSDGSSRNLYKLDNPGILNGLRLELFVGNQDYSAETVRNSGLLVMINNQTSKPVFTDGYEIATGIMTNINVNRLYTHRLDNPYNDCIKNLDTINSFDSDLYRTIINSNVTYRSYDCFTLCFQKQVIEKCKCHYSFFEKLNSTIPCINFTDVVCSLGVWNEYLVNRDQKCPMYCPTECDSVSYSITTSFSDYPTKSYAETELMNIPFIKEKFLNKSISYEQLKGSVLSFDVYYDQLSYVVISQQAKTNTLDVISNIGGLLGLFLGFSFLSFIEFVEALFEVFRIVLSSKLKKNNLIEVKEIN